MTPHSTAASLNREIMALSMSDLIRLDAQELELALNELTPEGVPDLATALRGMPALRRLNLRENELESAGAVALAPVLASLSALQELDLSGNQIKRAGAVAVAKALAGLPAFERLLLDENEISADGVAQIKVRAVQTCAGISPSLVNPLHVSLPDVIGEAGTGQQQITLCGSAASGNPDGCGQRQRARQHGGQPRRGG